MKSCGQWQYPPQSRHSQDAFEDAIESGRLSHNPNSENYVSRYMYMVEKDGRSLFKNRLTREYLA